MDYLIRVNEKILSLKNVVKRYGDETLLFVNSENDVVFETDLCNVMFVLRCDKGVVSKLNMDSNFFIDVSY